MLILGIKQDKKGKLLVHTDGVGTFPIYRKEAAIYGISFVQQDMDTDTDDHGMEWPDEQWERYCQEVLKKRVIKRAMFILQRQDRTESQLRQKLRENHYPEEMIDIALDYVKSFHYVDDYRYAGAYVRYHQSEKSRGQLSMTLQQRGVSKDIIEQVLEEEYEVDEAELIQKLLIKKHYDAENMDQKEKYRIYQYVMRKGFSGSEVRRVMNL